MTTTTRTGAAPPGVSAGIRWMTAALAAPHLITGVWAVLAPRHWYDSYPGFGPLLVAADPPFNAHLATDAGSGFLAVGVVLLIAAAWGERRVVALALAGFLAFAAAHLSYHAVNPAPGLSTSQNVVSVISLVLATAIPLALLLALRVQRKDQR